MNPIQQELNAHKNQLLTLINNLINTQMINQEIILNNEIKKECEFINSLLNIKQKSLMQNNIQNINFNQNIPQNNMIFGMNNPQINMMHFQNLNENEINNRVNNDEITVIFKNTISNENCVVDCKYSDKIAKIIEKYREKSNDYEENEKFVFGGRTLNPSLTVGQERIVFSNSIIKVIFLGSVKGSYQDCRHR